MIHLPNQSEDPRLMRYAEQFKELQEALQGLSYFCKGTILRRMEKCRRPSCRCMTSEYRHGPYFEWTYKEAGKTVNHRISQQKAAIYSAASVENKKLKNIL